VDTYGSIIRSYAEGVESGAYDQDLTASQRVVVARLLYTAAPLPGALAYAAGYGGRLPLYSLVAYPPSDSSRDEAAQYISDTAARSLVRPDDIGLTFEQWDDAVERARTIVRNV